MRVLIFGDSHTAALRRGQIAIETEGQWPDAIDLTVRPLGGGHLAAEPFFADRRDHAEVTLPEYRRQFSRIPREEDPEDTIYGVSAPLHPVRIWRNPAWQTHAPADMSDAAPGLAAEATVPVSSGMVRRLALADQRNMLDLVALLRRLKRRVFAIEAPRPFRHHPALRRTPAAVVMRVDALYRETIRAELARLDVPVVTVPALCLDPDGFVREDLGQASDPHHGNEAYGRIMMAQVLAHLAPGMAQPVETPQRETASP